MKVKCIDNEGVESCLTIGEIYDVSDSFSTVNKYDLVDDLGNNSNFFKYRFRALEDDADMVHHPNHYTYKSRECNKIIEIMCENINESEAYYLGAAIKYLYRYPMKNNSIQDLEKAKTYIDMIIEKMECEE